MARSARHRQLAALVAVAMVLSAGVAPLALADDRPVDEWPTGPERIFYADDPDDQSIADTNSSDLAQLGAAFDIYYRTTDRSFGSDDRSYSDYRIEQLRGVDRNDSTSKYLPESRLRDSATGVIKDAHVTYLGTVEGATPVTPIDGTDQEFIPADGRVLNFLDYRIDDGNLPEPDVDSAPGNFTNEVTDQEINEDETGVERRVVTINGREVGSATEDPEGRVIDYAGANGDGEVTLTIETTIVAVMDYTVITRNENGSIVDEEPRQQEAGSVTVRDTATVRVVDDQEATISQRYVDIEGQSTGYLAVRFDGPESITDRQIWSRLNFSSGTQIENNWGIYSTTRYTHGHIATDSGDTETFDFPHVLETKLTSSYARPQSVVDTEAVDEPTSPRIETVEQSQIADEEPTLGPQVNMTTTEPTVVDSMFIAGVPSQILDATDLFGRDVPVESEPTVTVRRSSIEIVEQSDGEVTFRLQNATTGTGLADRELSVQGAASDTVVTGDDGTATVEQTSTYVSASFDGDPWRADIRSGTVDGPYYGESSERLIATDADGLIASIIDLVRWLAFATPFFIGYFLVRRINERR
ncbi:hypothetical protein Hbl1158_14725 [Halobaculum sp. CBA1158]|uniref:hypothetical protein n=1 Tax=Halobaculum sp. CBA1158 TaxID=2904243 RepID=UPI001F16D27B|nr:hypothetical protein [Halobaculum sp. CBA1158]UIO99755.1 hypothetical protein Hbl1158_14725 [Halobaculum sp. CBA1158]